MKGFKSFADATELEFEPGVTAVVGPNGSGKSNVVDAVTWVLGAQSAKTLRSAKMDDVIFAGTMMRPALGRAEVTLTLDNALGKIPIETAEVTISRTLFRNSGDSEYAINGTTCRLRDIQELLSDSGVGRHQHMIIGQNQLDSVLQSSSESRREVIEEAAGVLKHRTRKVRAERRLEQTQENLERLGDLVREVRRQMRPLERQAQSARSYAEVELDLRQARHALYLERLEALQARLVELEKILESSTTTERSLRNEIAQLDAQATAAAAEMASRREELLASTLGKLQGLAERAKGIQSIIDERRRGVRQSLTAAADENVIANLEADAAKLVADLAALEADEATLAPEREAVATRRGDVHSREASFKAKWGDFSVASDEAALTSAREQLAQAQRALATSIESEERAQRRRDEVIHRIEVVTAERAAVEAEVNSAQASETEAESWRTQVAADLERAEAELVEAEAALRDATETAARTQARAEALARALEELSGSGGRAIVRTVEGFLGAFVDLIDIQAGYELAVESAAGASVGAMVVDGRQSARRALEALRREGGSGLVLPAGSTSSSGLATPAGCTPLRTLVTRRGSAPAHVDQVLDALFARAFVAPSFEEGMDISVANPDAVIVTREGDRFAASGWRVASGRAIVTATAVEEAARVAAQAESALAPATARRAAAHEAAVAAREAHNKMSLEVVGIAAHRERHASEVVRLAEELGQLSSTKIQLNNEVAEATAARELQTREVEDLNERIAGLEQQVANATERRILMQADEAALDVVRKELATAAGALQRREVELAERRRLIEQRRSEIEQRLEGRGAERAEAAARRERLEADVDVLDRLATVVERAADDIALSQDAMDTTYREQLEATRAGAERLEEIRQQRQAAEARLVELGDQGRHADVEHAEVALRIANVQEAIRRDLGVEPHDLGPAPHVELPEGMNLEARVGDLEARITSLGPINPLALEELTVLEERYRELDTQVTDIREARRELQEVIKTLNGEIMEIFISAVNDVSEHFSNLIAMLFPGGQGRLVLTDPNDPLNTGVEIEVRPMGRNIRRMSLLSGGERSMAAIAFLFSVFRSRPSPFYMMDEVEAALDDVNLQRFLSLVDEFRDEAQLLIVTHQKRTMEAADALYGVTMKPGASSKVVSQRVKKDRVPVAAASEASAE